MVDKNTLISIIIPVYNTEEYLEKCLSSIINQTIQDIEIICIDDNSKDNSLSILKNFAKQDQRIKIIQFDKNKGQGHARNIGIKEAKGKYIGFVDSDDWVELDMFKKLYTSAEAKNAEIVMCQALLYNEKSHSILEPDEYYSLSCLNEELILKHFNHYDTINILSKINCVVWNKLYRRNFLIQTGAKFPEGFIYEDIPFFYETYTKAKRVYFVKEFLYFYRINSSHSTMRKTDKNIIDRIEMIAHAFEILKKQTYFKDIKAAITDWIIHDLFYRCLIIDSCYQKEYFFRMQKFFRTIDISDIEEILLKSCYYPHFCEIRKRNYEDSIKYFFNQETLAAAYTQEAKKVFEKEYQALGERQQKIAKLEKENLQKKYNLEALQEKIKLEEKSIWSKANDIERQKSNNKLALARTKNILSNRFLENITEEKTKLIKEFKEESRNNQEYYSEMLKKQLELQQKNYEKANSFKKKIKEQNNEQT